MKLKQQYHCYNDCSQAGCPKHTATLEFNTVTDSIIFSDGKGRSILLEPPEANALVNMLKELDGLRADAPVKFSNPTSEEAFKAGQREMIEQVLKRKTKHFEIFGWEKMHYLMDDLDQLKPELAEDLKRTFFPFDMHHTWCKSVEDCNQICDCQKHIKSQLAEVEKPKEKKTKHFCSCKCHYDIGFPKEACQICYSSTHD